MGRPKGSKNRPKLRPDQLEAMRSGIPIEDIVSDEPYVPMGRTRPQIIREPLEVRPIPGVPAFPGRRRSRGR